MQAPIPTPVTGQPVWVTILLAVLGGAVALGIAYLTAKGVGKGRKAQANGPGPDTVTSNNAIVNGHQVVLASMEHLADALRRETKHNERLVKELRESERSKARIQAALDRCQEFAKQMATKVVNMDDEQRGSAGPGAGREGS